jgi:DNA polymerase-3 subunit epsilon
MYWLNPRTWFRRPHPWLVENQRHFAEFVQSRSLADYSFVAFDTELTGLDRRRDEIISLGAVRIDRLQIDLSDTFYQVVRPRSLARTGSTVIHRLTPGQLENAPYLEDIILDFVQFVGTSLIVGHYVDLDMFFLNRATWSHLGGVLSNPGIDTMRLAHGFSRMQRGYFSHDATPESYRLADLSGRFGLPRYTSHDAFQDAVQTACLFLWLIKKFRAGGRETLKDLYRAGHYRF